MNEGHAQAFKRFVTLIAIIIGSHIAHESPILVIQGERGRERERERDWTALKRAVRSKAFHVISILPLNFRQQDHNSNDLWLFHSNPFVGIKHNTKYYCSIANNTVSVRERNEKKNERTKNQISLEFAAIAPNQIPQKCLHINVLSHFVYCMLLFVVFLQHGE